MTTIKNEITMAISTALAAGLAVDGSAVLGAFVGAVLYSAIVSDSSMKNRIIFMLASFVAGYLGSPLFKEIPTGFVAFLISTGIVGLVLLFNKIVNKIDIEHLMELAKRWVDK